MNTRILQSELYLFILLIAQLTFIELISYKHFKPDILLIGLIYFTFLYGQIPGMISGFFFGLLLDILGSGLIGANALSKVIATFFAGYFSKEYNMDKQIISINFFAILLISSLIEKLVYTFVSINVEFKSLLIVYVNYGLIPSVITMVFSLFLLFFSRKREIIL